MLLCWGYCATAQQSDDRQRAAAESALSVTDWLADYAEAMNIAQVQQRMLFLYFTDGRATAANVARFEQEALSDPKVQTLLDQHFVTARLPLDATISSQGETVRLLEHGAFAELNGKPGVAIIDMAHHGTEQFGHVVSVFPLVDGRFYKFDPKHLSVLLELPPGTLTQRTMVFAVRIHPEAPSSTVGAPDPTLMNEAAQHSDYQARILNQGHHNWGHRFQRISRLLPGGLSAQEVVAESWPHQSLLDAAIDCVQSWRQSSGHWRAVRSWQPRFGYDIRRGRNGIWYATGIFGNRH